MDGSNGLVIDAVPQQIPVTFIENESNKLKIENLLSEFCLEDYKSALFLLMDYIGIDKFLYLTKKEESYLKKFFITLYYHRLNESILLELLGTLKMYKKLRMLGTCCHVYESKGKNINRIHGIWKILYSLCEELTDDDLDILKQHVQSNFKDQILSAEDWFCWALQNKLFSKTDLFYLEEMFKNYPNCLDIIKSYKDLGLYDVRIPTAGSGCGIAVIFNYDKFNENTGLTNRKNSYKDVASLKLLWETYGFQTDVYQNLTYMQTIETMDYYSSKNYSNCDVFVCCILSHGESKAVYLVDGELIEITDSFVAPIVNCISLNKKPKLFFIQACQGPNIHEGIGKPIYQFKTNNNKPMKNQSSPPPVLCDTLIVYSSIDGYVSYNDNEGSWFMQTLCKQMMEDGENSSIDEVMTNVHEEVRNKYSANFESLGLSSAFQIVSRFSTLGKKLMLKKRIE